MANNMQVTEQGGFVGGINAAAESGGAIGISTSTNSGGAVGRVAQSTNGGAVGNNAFAEQGGAVGQAAYAIRGGAVGQSANTSNGFAGGFYAQAQDTLGNGIDAVQLGTGENNTPKTFQVYDYPMMDENGNIPAERLQNAPKTPVVDNLSTSSPASALSAAQGKVLNDTKVDKAAGKGLSANDYTDADKAKLDGVEAGAQVNAVVSVSGKTGAVSLDKHDVGLDNVDNTSDINKPVSAAVQSALDQKADKAETYTRQESDLRYLPKGIASGSAAAANDQLHGAELIDYRVYGSAGGVGDLVAAGAQAGKYHIPVACRGKNLFNIQDFADRENVEIHGNTIIITGTKAKTGAAIPIERVLDRLKPNTTYHISVGSQEVLEGTAKTSTFYIGLIPKTGSANFYLKYSGLDGTKTLPQDLSGYAYFMILCGEDLKIRMSDIMLAEGDAATAYEPYCAPSTADIYLPAPLTEGEYVSYADQTAHYQTGGLPAAIPPLTAPESESMAVSAGTAVAPSDIRVNYYQDINKVIRNLQAAVSSL